MSKSQEIKIGVLGMGYVGLPLAVEFSKHFEVIGYDINKERISELTKGKDLTREVSDNELEDATNLFVTSALFIPLMAPLR